MKLFAKKPCSFCGKKFFIGNEIPSEYVLDPKAQEKMGVLVVVDENSVSSPENESSDSVEGGALLPPSSTLENAIPEGKTYSKNALIKMNKDELLVVAEKKGVEATAEMTNAAIVKMILEKQGE